jgi:hypothetical protein
LRRYEVKESFGATIQFVEFTITGLMVVLPTALIEYCKKKGSVVEGTVFDRIVQFRYLGDIESDSQTHYKMLVLTRDGSNFSGFTSQKSSKSFSQRSRKSQGSSPQHLGESKTVCCTFALQRNLPSFLDLLYV